MEGHSGWGEDSSIVSEQLGRCSTFKNVQRLQESWAAFAAVLVGGFVVAAGDLDRAGDSSAVQEQFGTFQQRRLLSAAVPGDGSVVTWGAMDKGGDSSAVQRRQRIVQNVQASVAALAASLGDGSVAAWGASFSGGG